MAGIENWNEDSILSRNGYSADGNLSPVGRKKVLDSIIKNKSAEEHLEVIHHFRWLIADREQRAPKAKRIWEMDLIYFCEKMNEKHSS